MNHIHIWHTYTTLQSGKTFHRLFENVSVCQVKYLNYTHPGLSRGTPNQLCSQFRSAREPKHPISHQTVINIACPTDCSVMTATHAKRRTERRSRKLIKKYLNEMEALPSQGAGSREQGGIGEAGRAERSPIQRELKFGFLFDFPLKLQKSHATTLPIGSLLHYI